MKVSFSAIQTFLTCGAKYAYKYRDGLRMIEAQPHFEVGSIIHAAFEPILTAHWRGESLPSAESAVREGCKALREKREMTLDSEEHAQLAVRALEYHVPRMRLESWETLTYQDRPAVELELLVPFGPGDTLLQAHIDWVARSKETGRVFVIDHKTSKHRMTDQGWCEFDLQLALYREACAIAGIHVDAALLHQLCFHPPSDVDPLKKPAKGARRFSVAKNQRTDWETYQNALIKAGEDPEQYLDMRDMLDDQVSKSPFRRWAPDVTTAAGHATLIEIALQAIERMRAVKVGGAEAQPNRVNEWTCGRCEMRSWCDAQLTGLDPRSLVLTVYQPDADSRFSERPTVEDDSALRLHLRRVSHTGRYDVHGFSPHALT